MEKAQDHKTNMRENEREREREGGRKRDVID